MNIARELILAAKEMMGEVGDIEVIEPVGSKPMQTRTTKKMGATVPREIQESIEDAAARAMGSAETLNAISRALDRGDVNAAATLLNRAGRTALNLIPRDVITFIETAGKKLPSSESWKAGVLGDMEEVMTDGEGADNIEYSAYLTYTDGTSNKFHYFAVFRYTQPDGTITYVGGNAYGRIGSKSKIIVIARGKNPGSVVSTVQRKQWQKEAKGYE